MSRPKDKGNQGERNHRRILARCWPDIKRCDNRYHPTRDHDNTEGWYVESKKRSSWNIKDVVRVQEQVKGPWLIAYEDSNRLLADSPSTVIGILPLKVLAEVLYYAYLGGYNDGHE